MFHKQNLMSKSSGASFFLSFYKLTPAKPGPSFSSPWAIYRRVTENMKVIRSQSEPNPFWGKGLA